MTDIEKALTDALAYAIKHHEHHDSVAIVACGRGRLDYCIPAILATPSMQAIARQAAIGAGMPKALDAIEEILAEYGLRTCDRDGIHRWRCEYPDRRTGRGRMTDPIRERHQHTVGTIDDTGKQEVCGYDWVPWPCDAIRALDELDKESMERADAERERDAARADADRLARALRRYPEQYHLRHHDFKVPLDECPIATCADTAAALRAHDEATR